MLSILPSKELQLILVLLVFIFPTNTIFGQWTNGQAAIKVFGQAGFGTSGSGQAANQFDGPTSAFLDKQGTLWVADKDNNRILRFDNAATKPNGANADGVLGQAGFGTIGPGNAVNQMNNPRSAMLDDNGTLWVVDETNNRILRFDNAATKPNGANANGVLGQAGFGMSGFGNAANQLFNPTCLAIDASGRLWVADRGNNRVLRFDNVATKPNGANADGVLGQAGFGTSGSGNAANQMGQPDGISIDPNGRLWVGDVSNDRVIRFDNAATKPNGANADGVLGQASFGMSGGGSGANQLDNPRGATVDCAGNLYVVETSNDRVSVFIDAANKANGANADFVLGQTAFGITGTGNGASQFSMGNTNCLSFDATNNLLWTSDDANNRVVAFQPSSVLCAVASPTPPIPTMGQWGLLIFGLLIMNLSIFFVRYKAYI